MAYTPGTLHVKRLMPNGDPAPVGSTVEVVPSSELIKDPTDGTVVLSGIVLEDLVAGDASITLPPTSGMDPDPVTYAVRVHIKGYEPEEWVTGIEITAGDVTELAEQTSVLPGPSVPNVQAELEALVGQGAGSAGAAGNSAIAAAQSATAALGSKNAAAQSAADADVSRQAAQTAAGTATTRAGEAQAAATAAASYYRSGTGSPEGVVAAPVGTEYRDLVGTNGAWVWRKRSGAGNTGWVCVEGDTGYRNMAQYLNTTFMTAGTLYWRRSTARGITLSLSSATFTASAAQLASGLPSQSDPWSIRNPMASIFRGNGVFGLVSTNGPGLLQVSGSAVTNSLGFLLELNTTSDLPWPTVLTMPGSAV